MAHQDVNVMQTNTLNNYLLIWLDEHLDQPNLIFQQNIDKLREIVDNVHPFNKADDCVDFLTDIDQQHVLLVISEKFGRQWICYIHDFPQLDQIYVISTSPHPQLGWILPWSKIKQVYTDIQLIYKDLRTLVNQFNHGFTPISFVFPTDDMNNINHDRLEPSFMYTKLFKDVLLKMNHDQQDRIDLVSYCRGNLALSPNVNGVLDEFEHDYRPDKAIWWYTRECFTYQMLNQALRTLQADIIVMMGFFIADLHRQIKQLHNAQIHLYQGQSLIVYRGQRLSRIDFDKLKKSEGGLMSFNSFLSTSRSRDMPFLLAESAAQAMDIYGIVFVISIDPKMTGALFADVSEISYMQGEDEILFTMHSVFRIDRMLNIGAQERLFEVSLSLTMENDEQLRQLNEYMQNKMHGLTATRCLSDILLHIGQPSMIEKLYTALQKSSQDPTLDVEFHYYQGCMKYEQCRLRDALEHFEIAMALVEKDYQACPGTSDAIYSMTAHMYSEMGDYSKSLSFYQKAFHIRRKTLPANHPSMATLYNNIGSLYLHMGEHSKALSFYQKALDIHQKILPANHPSMATSYNNIGGVYSHMAEFSKALSFYRKTLDIRQKTLPANHPSLTISYSNIADVYHHMGEYSKALSFYQKALDIHEKILPANHPSMATSYNNIGSVYHHMGEYPKALCFHQKALDIKQKTLPANHPSMATSYNNIGSVCSAMGEYSKALSFYQKALDIRQKTLPANHPSLATTYSNIGSLYLHIEEHSKALSFYQKALGIEQKTLPANHPGLATSYNNIGSLYLHMGEHSKALSFYQKALDIKQKTLPANHPSLATSYSNTGDVYHHMGEYSKALSFYQKALDIEQKTLPAN